MAWTYGFFNSINNDRIYNADTMSSIFEGLITDGVYESVGNKLAVSPNSGMVIQIGTGRGWFGKRWVNNDSPYLITLNDSDVTLNRYAAICIRVNANDDTRSAEPYVKYSDYATSPVKPTMTRTDTIKEYCLAYVFIKAGATAITESDIEDTRSHGSLCGWVTGLIDQLDSETLYTQFTALFNSWFSGLQDMINENTETMLVNALPTSVELLLPEDGWTYYSTDDYRQIVTVENMTPTKTVLIDAGSQDIECIAQGTNSLTFRANKSYSNDTYVNLLHMGV